MKFEKHTLELGEVNYSVRAMAPGDEQAMSAFASSLPVHDLLFVRRDIRNDKVIAAWLEGIAKGDIVSVLALEGTRIAACGALICDPLSWSPHVGEVRVLVGTDDRGKGLGREIILDVCRLAADRGLKKLTAQMTVDQVAAITIFEECGFRGEALLKEHVQDASGETHDIVMLSCEIARAGGLLEAYE